MSDRNECLEVGSLDETEIVRVDAEHIIHHYPAVLADAFPDIGSLAAFRLVVYLSSYIVVTCIYLVRKSNLDSPGFSCATYVIAYPPSGRGHMSASSTCISSLGYS